MANNRGLRSDKSFQRRGRPDRQPRQRILIVCEGEKTEPIYFKELHRSKRVPAEVEICGEECGSHPKNVVEFAVKKISRATRDKLPYDKVWCVYDRDEHQKIEEVHVKARANSIEVAFSNPCFELWYLLHFKCHTAHIERGEVINELLMYIPKYEKGLKMFSILPQSRVALEHAEKLRERHENSYRTVDSNPSTTVDLLVKALCEMAGE